MNVIYAREGLYMPSTKLQINALEEKFGQIFDKVVIEDVTSTSSLKSLIDRETVYAYLPQCIIDIDCDCEYAALEYLDRIGDHITFFDDYGKTVDKSAKFEIAKVVYLSVYASFKAEKRLGALVQKETHILTNIFPFDKCVDENTEYRTNGEYYVYLWEETLFGDVFYVGSGKGNRYAKVGDECRSEDFMQIYNSRETKPYIVCCGMNETEARELETNLIKQYIKLGFRLVNRKDNPLRTTKISDSTLDKEIDYMSYWS